LEHCLIALKMPQQCLEAGVKVPRGIIEAFGCLEASLRHFLPIFYDVSFLSELFSYARRRAHARNFRASIMPHLRQLYLVCARETNFMRFFYDNS